MGNDILRMAEPGLLLLKCMFPFPCSINAPCPALPLSPIKCVRSNPSCGCEFIFHSVVPQAGNFVSTAPREGIHEACGTQFKEKGRMKVQPPTFRIPSPALPNHFSSCLTAQTKYESTWKKKYSWVFFKLSPAKGNGCPRLRCHLSGTLQVLEGHLALQFCFVKPDRWVMFCPLPDNCQELFAPFLFFSLKWSEVKVTQSCPILCNPMNCSCQAPLSTEF